MLLHQLAHARTGDKGNIVTISLIAFRKDDFPLLEQKVTAERVAAHFAELLEDPVHGGPAQQGSVQRYTLPQLGALNFVVRGLRELPGRKSAILISDGLRLFGRNRDNSIEIGRAHV